MNDIIIDHVGLTVSDYDKLKHFYLKALKPLGITMMSEFPIEVGHTAGFGKEKPILWLSGPGPRMEPHVHIAFTANTRAEVDAFHEAALAAGGTENGPPGLRPHYHQTYYAAFVLDPDGHNIEAVCHR